VNKQMAHRWHVTECYCEWGLGMSSLSLERDFCPVLFQEATFQTLTCVSCFHPNQKFSFCICKKLYKASEHSKWFKWKILCF